MALRPRFHATSGNGLNLCIVPVPIEDCQLLGMKWQDAFYVDVVLSFSVRSPLYIFTCIADLVEWVAKQNYDVTFLMHYLDDFHTLGPCGSSACQQNLDRSIDCFSKLAIGHLQHACTVVPQGRFCAPDDQPAMRFGT